MSMSTAENIEPEYSIAAILEKVNNLVVDKATLREELDAVRQELAEKHEAIVYLTEQYDNNLDTVLHKLNRRTFELMEANQELAARVNSCPSTCEAYKL